MIVAASHLDAVTFQICSQSFKIMPTAFFAVWLLGQYLTPLQWGSLPVLAVGVVFVTMNGSTPAGALSAENCTTWQAWKANKIHNLLQRYLHEYPRGVMLVLVAEQLWHLALQDSC